LGHIWKGQVDFFHVKEQVLGGGKQPLDPGFSILMGWFANAEFPTFERHPQGSPAGSQSHGKHLFAVVTKNKIPFPEGTTGDPLHRIHRAGIIFDDRHQLFILGPERSEPFHDDPGGPVADGQPRAHVRVEADHVGQVCVSSAYAGITRGLGDCLHVQCPSRLVDWAEINRPTVNVFNPSRTGMIHFDGILGKDL
jgi:hypothetical protein